MLLTISSFGLSLEGLQLSYTLDSQTTTVQFDACATCTLLKAAGIIEDFTTDRNGEPVILYSDSYEPAGYGYELWHRFVHSFPISLRIAEMIIEYREETTARQKTIAQINYLLSPLQATA